MGDDIDESGPRVHDVHRGRITFSSTDADLEAAFEWAKEQALAYAFEDDPVGPWYEAGLPGRESFCMRDVAHQCSGAHALGLAPHNKNMLRAFAEAISEARDWCSLWHIDRHGRPPRTDYFSDDEFWYNLPANFDVLDACYRVFTWTGDWDYLTDPAFEHFYDRTVHDYVERWELGVEQIMDRERLLNTPSGSPVAPKFHDARGIPGYDEQHDDYTVGVDQLASQYAGYRAYARILQFKGDLDGADAFLDRADAVTSLVDTEWWDDDHGYYTHLEPTGELVKHSFDGDEHGSIPHRLLYHDAVDDGARLASILDEIVDTIPHASAEMASHIPEILYRYGRVESARELLLELPRLPRREYPEVSFSLVGGVVSGMMGVDPDVVDPGTPGGFDANTIATRPRLGPTTRRATLERLPVRANDLSITHVGDRETSLTNHAGPALQWHAWLQGGHDHLVVDGDRIEATREPGAGDTDHQFSTATVVVGPGETVTVGTPA